VDDAKDGWDERGLGRSDSSAFIACEPLTNNSSARCFTTRHPARRSATCTLRDGAGRVVEWRR